LYIPKWDVEQIVNSTTATNFNTLFPTFVILASKSTIAR